VILQALTSLGHATLVAIRVALDVLNIIGFVFLGFLAILVFFLALAGIIRSLPGNIRDLRTYGLECFRVQRARRQRLTRVQKRRLKRAMEVWPV